MPAAVFITETGLPGTGSPEIRFFYGILYLEEAFV